MEEDEKKKADRIARNIEKADVADLVLIAKYTNQKKKLQKAQVFISSIIATMAGAAIVSSYLFPELDNIWIAVGSVIFGVIIVSLSFWQRKKEEMELLSRLLRESENPSSDDLEEAESFRKEMLKSLRQEEK